MNHWRKIERCRDCPLYDVYFSRCIARSKRGKRANRLWKERPPWCPLPVTVKAKEG